MQIKLCWFNQHWNVYLYTIGGYDSWNVKNTKIIRDERPEHAGEYRLREYDCVEIPIFSFGFMADDKHHRPGHGGEWSSNSSNINKIFGTNIIEVAVDQVSVAVPIEWLKELLGDNVEWGHTWSQDYLEILKVKNHPNPKYTQWIELTPKLVS